LEGADADRSVLKVAGFNFAGRNSMVGFEAVFAASVL
jgi:hypothetical protein